ncbi:ferrous iron transport protein A [Streptomyces virginiae]|uniref:ferrous iron transport protein A n=1 Tax=Streptomyces virginiae TaxID=1961 RepID=UPI003863E5ED|nr:ferrous iron transport protein A [Streptomyces virginiae]
MAASSSSSPSSSSPSSDAANTRDRAAVEQLMGRALPQEWPSAALPAGSRVVVVRDPGWDGPWRNEFLGTIDGMGAPEPVERPRARAGELAYWVTFDEPQYDGDGDGPYRKAFIWDRYLRPTP